jgi:hypothetical protein
VGEAGQGTDEPGWQRSRVQAAVCQPSLLACTPDICAVSLLAPRLLLLQAVVMRAKILDLGTAADMVAARV